MTKKHDELVEEIVTIITNPTVTYHPNVGAVYAAIDKGLANRMAESLITLALSAVRDGLELPDEVGRERLIVSRGASEDIVVDATALGNWLAMMATLGATDFIAFHKEGGK